MLHPPPPYYPPPDTGLPLIHEDPAFLLLNKPSGLLSVPGRGAEKADCLASRVQARFPEALIVHRLDMETSGLLLMARGPDNQRLLSSLFEQRMVAKNYIALLEGLLEMDSGEVSLPLIADWPRRPRQKVDHETGKPSLTRFRRLEWLHEQNLTRVELEPITGRSHQLRVHMLSLGHPILGDALYAEQGSRNPGRLMLHARFLRFPHPVNGQTCEFLAESPF